MHLKTLCSVLSAQCSVLWEVEGGSIQVTKNHPGESSRLLKVFKWFLRPSGRVRELHCMQASAHPSCLSALVITNPSKDHTSFPTVVWLFPTSPPDSSWSQVILSGYNGDHPPADQEGFLEFARSLQAPDVYNKLKEATPLTPVMCCGSPAAALNPTLTLLRVAPMYTISFGMQCRCL